MSSRASQNRRGSGPSQSQYASQRRRGVPSEDEEDGEQDYDDDDEEDEETHQTQNDASQTAPKKKKKATGSTQKSGLTSEEIRRRANDLVRMALFEEPQRGVIKRTDIVKRILPEDSRSFNSVFSEAQRVLRHTFGMELTELMTRNERDQVGEAKEPTGEGRKKKAAVTSKTYILRSTLDPELVELANKKDTKLFDAEIKDMKDMGLPTDNLEDTEKPHGTLYAWNSVEPAALTGLLQLILCLIVATGRSLPEVQLKKHLKTFHLGFGSVLSLPPRSSEREIKLEAYLINLVKQNYLDRVRVGHPGSTAPAQSQPSRRKSRMEDDDGEASFEWRWGSRAHAEIGEESVAGYVADFMSKAHYTERSRLIIDGEDDDEDDVPAPRGKRAAAPAKRTTEEQLEELKVQTRTYRAAVFKDISLAAGGHLTKVTAKREEE